VLAKIKLAGIFLLGLGMTILYALLQKSEADKARLKEKVATKSAEIQSKAAQANIKGEADEHETRVKPVKDIKDEF
jgi:hypothetical protein